MPIAIIVRAKKSRLAVLQFIAAPSLRPRSECPIYSETGAGRKLIFEQRPTFADRRMAADGPPHGPKGVLGPPRDGERQTTFRQARACHRRSRGIGAATAEALAAAGAHVILVARTASALEEIEERIHEAGGTATIAPLDLTDGESIGKLAGAVAERWKKLDIFVLNAAMLGSLTPVQDIDPKEYSRLLSLNLLANQALIAAFDPLGEAGRQSGRDRAHFLGRGRATGILGRIRFLEGSARNAARRLCG